jgi:hypothetical protein
MTERQREFDEQHRIVLESYESQRTEIERAAAEQAERLATERAAFERLMKERQEQLAAVRAELDKQRAEIARRLVVLDKRRAAIEKMSEEVSRRAANTPVARQSIPDDDQPPDAHWAIPVSLAAILLLLIASLVATMSHQRRPASSAGEVMAPRSAPLVRPAPARTPALRRPTTIPDTSTARLDTSGRDTIAHDTIAHTRTQ